MTAQEAFEKWRESGWSCTSQAACESAFQAGISYQKNQQLLCLADIRAVLGDKEVKLSQEEVVQKVKGFAEAIKMLLLRIDWLEGRSDPTTALIIPLTIAHVFGDKEEKA